MAIAAVIHWAHFGFEAAASVTGGTAAYYWRNASAEPYFSPYGINSGDQKAVAIRPLNSAGHTPNRETVPTADAITFSSSETRNRLLILLFNDMIF